jgi:hypothetical protein
MKDVSVFSGCSFREMVFVGDLSDVLFEDCELSATEFEESGGVTRRTNRPRRHGSHLREP